MKILNTEMKMKNYLNKINRKNKKKTKRENTSVKEDVISKMVNFKRKQ